MKGYRSLRKSIASACSAWLTISSGTHAWDIVVLGHLTKFRIEYLDTVPICRCGHTLELPRFRLDFFLSVSPLCFCEKICRGRRWLILTRLRHCRRWGKRSWRYGRRRHLLFGSPAGGLGRSFELQFTSNHHTALGHFRPRIVAATAASTTTTTTTAAVAAHS